MRKKTETAIKVLNEKIEKLEGELDKQYILNRFLLEHDRYDVKIERKMDYVALTYAYEGKLMFPCIGNRFYLQNTVIYKNSKESVILKINSIPYDDRNTTYIKIKKSSGESMDVTDIILEEQKPTTVANSDTPTETDFKYFTAEQVRNMSQKEVKENYSDIMKSMKKWG